MNKTNLDLLKLIKQQDIQNQRELAELSGYSLGLVNRELKRLRELELVDAKFNLTSKAKALFKKINQRMPLFWLLDLECVWFQLILKRQKGFLK